ncbi:hypothetical protein [Streptomyces sp. NPDC018347]|uniref:hypothetical protein n=1 Tax=Streptomyces sp. NPDC018347 TaxID=3157193 RepID=UPI0033CF9D97
MLRATAAAPGVGVREATRSGPAAPRPPTRLERVMGHRAAERDEEGCLPVRVRTPRRAPADGAAGPVLGWDTRRRAGRSGHPMA